jgi:hypothetical protein
MQTLYDCIKRAIKEGRLEQPFSAKNVKSVCSGWADSTYPASLAKHEESYTGNYRKYYKRVSRGRYCLIRKIH